MGTGQPPPVLPRDEEAPILAHSSVAPGHFLMRLRASYAARHARPGQFVQIRVRPSLDPFLRRPFSISRTAPEAGWMEALYKVVGQGTAALAGRTVGETVSVLGPLGRPFRLPDRGAVLLVGGGVGMPPLFFAANHLPAGRTQVFQGARTARLLLYEREFDELGIACHWTTEDGTAGLRGLVTDALGAVLDSLGEPAEILSCGPLPMMAAVAGMAAGRRIVCQVSLEERMACGFGIGMGCAVRLATSRSASPDYALVCTDGPVFDAQDVFAFKPSPDV